jgi:hypothetical protein
LNVTQPLFLDVCCYSVGVHCFSLCLHTWYSWLLVDTLGLRRYGRTLTIFTLLTK